MPTGHFVMAAVQDLTMQRCQSTELHLPTANRMKSKIWRTRWEFRSDPGCALLRQGSPTSQSNFTFLQPANLKFITTFPLCHLSVRSGVCLHYTVPTHSLAKYEPHTCPYAKVINQLIDLPSQYYCTSLICSSMRIHEAPISLLQKTAQISVIGRDINSRNFPECYYLLVL